MLTVDHHAKYAGPTRQHELDSTDHTDQGNIGPEASSLDHEL